MIDGYLLQEVIGEGASGVVHLAVTPAGDRAAIKILRPERLRDATARARFVREARLMTSIDSRHVVRILAVRETADTVYLVMPFYDGGSLAGRGPLSLADVVALASQIARGLDLLHERSIVHRDLKPSNVLLTRDGTAALTDFGLALAADSTRVTDTGVLVGTPHYLAPEVIAGGDATRRTDIYAFGCVLYELLAGQPPFAKATRPAELSFAHLAEPVPDIRGTRSDVMLALRSALAKDPAERPTSATALARMLSLAHKPALA
ncbi:MAG TPA: serine/threonine-protein kinase [Gaiellaceae bacterium]|nr:serine/threonine-protein kinase [Gaiellaceae bacterium]HWJ44119.1 serine/threonine-protein kinase [Gaiellaceae bacterium]